ncbi:MAG: mechanosensitive ion channel family protein [Gammaproteobacteria bacterium]|nr:mechanosensitive ion channel family protein [Gammaproteobacteria bacterium]
MPFLPDNWLSLVAGLVILVAGAWIVDWVTTRVVHGAIRRVAARTRSSWDDRVIERKVFARLSHIVPAAIVFYGIGPVLGVTPAEAAAGTEPAGLILAWTLARRLSAAVIVMATAAAFSAFLDAVNDIYVEAFEQSRSRPIKGYLQGASLLAYLGAGVVAIAILANQSPLVFLSGIGALTAVLMLIFRDTILSLVASIQIMSNDMIRIGDWVSMPQANTDGDVIEIALHTVKIQNWDKTISTIPTHKFISESFKNWRGMTESGGRRIKRSLRIDMNSVRFLSDGEVDRLSRYETLREYMTEARRKIESYNAAKAEGDPGIIPEIRRLTNLGTFRLYVFNYLKGNPRISQEMTVLARQLAPGPQGVPIEVYCFSSDTAWANYEGLQADLFDHLIAILPEFGLRAFQEPSGSDFAEALRAGGGERREPGTEEGRTGS